MRKEQRLVNNRKMSRNSEGKIVDAVDNMLSAGLYWKQEEAFNTVGDANADGTSLLTITITAGSTFYCTSAQFGTNIAAICRIGTGTLGAMTDYYWVDCQNVGFTAIQSDGDVPLFIIDNSTGITDLTLRLYVPQTGYGLGITNNDANHYFHAFVGGLLVA